MRLILACLTVLALIAAPIQGAVTGDPIDGNENPTYSELDCEALAMGDASPYTAWQCDVYLHYLLDGWWDWPWW